MAVPSHTYSAQSLPQAIPTHLPWRGSDFLFARKLHLQATDFQLWWRRCCSMLLIPCSTCHREDMPAELAFIGPSEGLLWEGNSTLPTIWYPKHMSRRHFDEQESSAVEERNSHTWTGFLTYIKATCSHNRLRDWRKDWELCRKTVQIGIVYVNLTTKVSTKVSCIIVSILILLLMHNQLHTLLVWNVQF